MRSTAIIILLLSWLGMSAQTDTKAKSILEQASNKMQSFQSISADFAFTMDNTKMNIHEKNSGSLLMKGKKYLVKLPEMGMQVICDGQTVWNFMKEANQVTISDAGDEGQGVIDPATIFNVYQEGYLFRFIEDKQVNGKMISFIEMTPEDKNKEFTKLVVGIEKQSLLVNSLVTHGKDGNQYGIYVSVFKSNPSVADSEFFFDKVKHPGVEVVDFR